MPLARGLIALLHALSAPYGVGASAARIDTIHLVRDIGPLILGWSQTEAEPAITAMRLSDAGLVKLFRLIRLARHLIELESGMADGDSVPPAS